MSELFAYAFVLGLLFNATPGAVFAATLRYGLTGGFRPALLVQVGSLVGDFVWAVLGLAGVAALFALPYVEVPLAAGGAVLLLWLAWGAWRDANAPIPAFDARSDASKGNALKAGVALSLSNPWNVTYWAGLSGTVAAFGSEMSRNFAMAIFLAGFMASSLLWCFVCAWFVAWARRRLSRALWRGVNVACAAGFVMLAGLVVLKLAER
ncbi:MAG: LysE family transporter [Tagaea sp.]